MNYTSEQGPPKTYIPDGNKSDSETKINPPHYHGDRVMCIIEEFDLDFLSGTIVKYLLRAGKKTNETELIDLKKAQWYLNRKIVKLEDQIKEG